MRQLIWPISIIKSFGAGKTKCGSKTRGGNSVSNEEIFSRQTNFCTWSCSCSPSADFTCMWISSVQLNEMSLFQIRYGPVHLLWPGIYRRPIKTSQQGCDGSFCKKSKLIRKQPAKLIRKQPAKLIRKQPAKLRKLKHNFFGNVSLFLLQPCAKRPNLLSSRRLVCRVRARPRRLYRAERRRGAGWCLERSGQVRY